MIACLAIITAIAPDVYQSMQPKPSIEKSIVDIALGIKKGLEDPGSIDHTEKINYYALLLKISLGLGFISLILSLILWADDDSPNKWCKASIILGSIAIAINIMYIAIGVIILLAIIHAVS